jgi:hypothetical protein
MRSSREFSPDEARENFNLAETALLLLANANSKMLTVRSPHANKRNKPDNPHRLATTVNG